MKLSDLEAVRTIVANLGSSKARINAVKAAQFNIIVDGRYVDAHSIVLTKRIQDELLQYFETEYQLIARELTKLGVEVDNETR